MAGIQYQMKGTITEIRKTIIHDLHAVTFDKRTGEKRFKMYIILKSEDGGDRIEGHIQCTNPEGDWAIGTVCDFILDINGNWRNIYDLKPVGSKKPEKKLISLLGQRGTVSQRDSGMIVGAAMNNAVAMFINDKKLSIENRTALNEDPNLEGISFMKYSEIENVARSLTIMSLRMQNEITR